MNRIAIFAGTALMAIAIVELILRLKKRGKIIATVRYLRYAIAFFATVIVLAILDYYLAIKTFGPLEPVKDSAAIWELSNIAFRTKLVSAVCSTALIILYLLHSPNIRKTKHNYRRADNDR
jgi:hypothetical protein